MDKAESKEWLADSTPITALDLNAEPFYPNCFFSKNLSNKSFLAIWSKYVELDNKGARESIKENI